MQVVPVKKITIATRGSKLALWQAEYVKNALLAIHGSALTVELCIIKTKGDIILDVPLSKVGGKGLFVKEIEEALLDNRADVAVHSMKDVPMELPEPLQLGVICKRENPSDVFLSTIYPDLSSLPKGARLGTSSLRRQSQVLALRPDVTVESIRGNVETRIQKMKDGQFSAIIMAAAGLIRLGLTLPYMQYLTPPEFLPAAGQGAIGLEYKRDREDLHTLFTCLSDGETSACVRAERAFLRGLDGGCQVPIAAYATLQKETLTLEGLIASVDGKKIFREKLSGVCNEAESLGSTLASTMKTTEASAILKDIYKVH